MFPKPETRDHLLFFFALAAAALIQVSIAASQTMLGLGFVLLLVFRRRIEMPRIWVPLLCFFFWTVLADIVSPDPWGGRAQIKKFFVFLLLPLIYSVFSRSFQRVFYLMLAWAVAATASAALALGQFAQYAHVSYMSYVGRRITGFESHWMTFGALQLSVVLLLLAQLFVSDKRMPWWAYLSVLILTAAILLGGTRSIWLAAAPSVLYLVWFWQPRMIFALPLLAAIGFALAPHNVRERALSVIHPQENIDSNRHRAVTFRTGIEMIKAHPWFGVGPEEIKRNFDSYVPKDVRRPLPVGYYGHLHNIYVQYAAERGVPGLLFLLWFISLAIYDTIRSLLSRGLRSKSQETFILHATLAVTIAILVGGVFEYNLGDSEVLMMFVTTVALAYAAIGQPVRDQSFVPSAQTVSK